MTEAKDPRKKAGDAGLTAGEQLKKAREERNLTVQQVGQALHLDTWILEALEEGRFRDVGAPVFVKGHLRKYAAEVGVDQDALMEAYYRAEDTPETPELVTDTFSRPEAQRQSRWPVIAVSAIAVLLIIVVSALWLRSDSFGLPGFGEAPSEAAQEAADEVSTSAQQPASRDNERQVALPDPRADSALAISTDLSVENADTGKDAKTATNLAQVSAGTASDAAGPASVAGNAVPDDGQVELSISFSEDSWVEIYDASRRRLFFDLARAGTTHTVRGQSPVQVLLGNSNTARVRVNGEVWPIPAAARRGKTARFTVR